MNWNPVCLLPVLFPRFISPLCQNINTNGNVNRSISDQIIAFFSLFFLQHRTLTEWRGILFCKYQPIPSHEGISLLNNNVMGAQVCPWRVDNLFFISWVAIASGRHGRTNFLSLNETWFTVSFSSRTFRFHWREREISWGKRNSRSYFPIGMRENEGPSFILLFDVICPFLPRFFVDKLERYWTSFCTIFRRCFNGTK